MVKRKFSFGFTLAKVLITLAIIGVVAAMTLPVIINKHIEKSRVITLKNTVSTLSNALRMAIAENGEPSNWPATVCTANSPCVDVEFLTDNLKLSKNCRNEAQGCWPDGEIKKFNGSAERNFERLPYYSKFVLANGVIIAIQIYGSGSTSSLNPIPSNNGEIWVDVNGRKQPNTVGKDIFILKLNGANGGKITGYFDSHTLQTENSKPGFNQIAAGYTLSLWVLAFENQDYLHCYDDLTWGGKHSCREK